MDVGFSNVNFAFIKNEKITAKIKPIVLLIDWDNPKRKWVNVKLPQWTNVFNIPIEKYLENCLINIENSFCKKPLII